MSRAARFFWVCAASAGLCFVALLVLSWAELNPGGLGVFDAQFFGYDAVFAVKYLGGLQVEEVGLYLGQYRQLDTAFPILLAVSLGGALWLNTGGMHPVLRLMLLLAPACYLMMDLTENAAVARLLRALPVVDPGPVAWASGFTQAKWVSLAGALVLVLGAWLFAPKVRSGRVR